MLPPSGLLRVSFPTPIHGTIRGFFTFSGFRNLPEMGTKMPDSEHPRDISATRLSNVRPCRLSAPSSRMVKYYRVPLPVLTVSHYAGIRTNLCRLLLWPHSMQYQPPPLSDFSYKKTGLPKYHLIDISATRLSL